MLIFWVVGEGSAYLVALSHCVLIAAWCLLQGHQSHHGPCLMASPEFSRLLKLLHVDIIILSLMFSVYEFG